MHPQINSTQNTRVKALFQLKEKSRIRKKEGVFLIEGSREITLAIKGNYTIKTILYCTTICSTSELSRILKTLDPNTEIIQISPEVYQKLAHRSTTEGIIALAQAKNHSLETLKFNNKNPLILVAEAPEKPGNIGALLRTSDAAGIDTILIANPKTDLYNPNIIRSSVGCVFTTTIATGTTDQIISFLKSQEIAIYCAALQASVHYNTIDYKSASAIVVGTEATGLSQEWRDHATSNIIIPMHGVIDSMNVSVAAGILLYEAKRQRGF